MNPENRKRLEIRVIQAAQGALDHHQYVSAIDVLVGIGWLMGSRVVDWRRGKIPYLEKAIGANLHKISLAMKIFRGWANSRGLKPSQTAYLARTRDPKRDLQFSKGGNSVIEKAYRTHFVSPELSEKRQERLREKLSQQPELVVFWAHREGRCFGCKADLPKNSLVFMQADQPLCLRCAKLDCLVFLPSGDAKLTRRAKQYSALKAVVVRFSRARKRYERQGILVEKDSLEKAKKECLTVFGEELPRQGGKYDDGRGH